MCGQPWHHAAGRRARHHAESYVLEVHRRTGLKPGRTPPGPQGLSYEDLCGKGRTRSRLRQVDVDKASTYAGEDSDQCLHLHEACGPLEADAGLMRIYRDIEPEALCWRASSAMRAGRRATLAGAEPRAGPAPRATGAGGLRHRRAALQPRLTQAARRDPVHQAQPAHRQEDRHRRPSTDEEVLKTGRGLPLPAKILEHRAPVQAQGTYTDKLPPARSTRAPAVHTLRAGGGERAASSNEPEPAEHPHPHPEAAACARPSSRRPAATIVSADYSQIELRIMAHLSGDPACCAPSSRADVHRATASRGFGTPLDQVPSEQRRYAKVINFGLIYGMSAFCRPSRWASTTRPPKLHRPLLRALSGVKRYMDDAQAGRPRPGLCRNRVRPAPVLPRSTPQRPAPRGAERRPSTRPCRARRPT